MTPTLLFKWGHSYWLTDRGIAVADNSMRVWGKPETTDDGLLLLDEEKLHGSEAYYQVVGAARPTICLNACCSQSVPLKTLSGKTYTTPASAQEFIKLCQVIHERRRLAA